MLLSIWLKKTGKAWWIAALPMAFMAAVTMSSLFYLILPAFADGKFAPDAVTVVVIVLFTLSSMLFINAVFRMKKAS